MADSRNTNMIPDRSFDRIAVAKNGEVLYDTGKNRCDKASSIKYLKRVLLVLVFSAKVLVEQTLRCDLSLEKLLPLFFTRLKLDINDTKRRIFYLFISLFYLDKYNFYFLIHFNKIQVFY